MKVAESCTTGHFLLTCSYIFAVKSVLYSHKLMHGVRDRQTERQMDNIITPMGNQYERLITMT